MKGIVTYQRTKPCVACGGTEFYISNPRLCKPCGNKKSREYAVRNHERHQAKIREWQRQNYHYLKVYRKALRISKRHAVPAIFAFYMMTRGAA